MAVLLELAEELERRPVHSRTTVRLVFFAAEEERALGSWAYARSLAQDPRVLAVNLEAVGSGEGLAYVSEEAFMIRRFQSSRELATKLSKTARDLWGKPFALRGFRV